MKFGAVPFGLLPNQFTIETMPDALQVLLDLRIARVQGDRFDFNAGVYLFDQGDALTLLNGGFTRAHNRPFYSRGGKAMIAMHVNEHHIQTLLDAHSKRFV